MLPSFLTLYIVIFNLTGRETFINQDITYVHPKTEINLIAPEIIESKFMHKDAQSIELV